MSDKTNPPLRLEITQTHYWLVMRALSWLTSQVGEMALYRDYPDMNRDELARDLADLIDRLELANQRREFEKRSARKK